MGEPEWWQGRKPTRAPRGRPSSGAIVTGELRASPDREPDRSGLRPWYIFKAQVTEAELWLNDVQLVVEWSEFSNCHFRQRVKPMLNEHGFSAQGSFGNSPAIYRHCVFERVRFKALGGFNLGSGWFEDCHFVNCRWDGHFADSASLVDCTFAGRMNGCVWFGESHQASSDRPRANVLRGNDFSQVQFAGDVGWRRSFPLADQRWPSGFAPIVDG